MADDEYPLLRLLKDKKQLLKSLFEMLSRSYKYAEGLRGMKQRGFSQEGMLDKLIEVTAIQSEQIAIISQIAIIYAQSSDFDASVAHLLNKLGHGEEALKAMLKAKFGK